MFRTCKSFSTTNEPWHSTQRRFKSEQKKRIVIHSGLTSFMVDRFGAASILQCPHVSIVAAVEILEVSSRTTKGRRELFADSPINDAKRSRLLPYGSRGCRTLFLPRLSSNQRTLLPAWLRRAPISWSLHIDTLPGFVDARFFSFTMAFADCTMERKKRTNISGERLSRVCWSGLISKFMRARVHASVCFNCQKKKKKKARKLGFPVYANANTSERNKSRAPKTGENDFTCVAHGDSQLTALLWFVMPLQ